MIRDILMYLDRVYVAQASVEPVYPLGLRIFRNEIVDYPMINEHLKVTLLGMISLERQKEIIEWWVNYCIHDGSLTSPGRYSFLITL